MANTVDERIVEAKFDASDFEKGVDKTVKKLDELKQALNLKDSEKNIAEYAKDTSENVEKAGNALERLNNRLTTFKGLIKQKILSGLADEFSQAFLKIEQTLLRFTKSLGSEQISAGMNKYTEILNSVRTMTAAGVDQEVAYKAIKRLGDYSDQTSYSLSQMTNGMSQLVAAGMDIDRAEKSMEGLANMCASAGVNIQSAQRAFMNFSQAYGSGKMQIKDWTSFEMLNMATEPIKKIFMEAGVQAGALVKSVDKAGKEVYKTVNTTNKAIKANKEVTSATFRDTLTYGWLDKSTMEQATAILSYFEDLGADMSKLTDEELSSFAAKAFQAAKEARSFTDVMGTLKDVIATGWATTFELIFGKLDKATEFFTWLTESRVADAIYAIGEFRNAVLTAWGVDWLTDQEGGIFHQRDIENGILGTGRDMLLDTLHNIDDMVGAVHDGLVSLFPEEVNIGWKQNVTFAQKLGYDLAMLTKQMRTTTKGMLQFFAVEEEFENDSGEKEKHWVLKPEYLAILKNITTAIGNVTRAVGAVFGIGSKLAGIVGKTFAKLAVVVQPAIEAINGAIAKIFDPIVNLNKNDGFFNSITKAIDNLLKLIDPVMKPLGQFIGFLGDLGAFFIQNGIDILSTNIEIVTKALGFFIELFGGKSSQQAEDGIGIIEGWSKSLKEFARICKEGLGAITSFFDALFEDIKNMFGIGEQTKGEKGGVFGAVKEFFDTNAFVKGAKVFVKNLPAKLAGTAKNLWNTIDEFLFGAKIQGKSKTFRIKKGFSKWLDDTVNSIRDWFKNAPQHLKDLWNSINEKIFGKDIIETVTGPDGKKTEVIKSGFSKWMDSTIGILKGWLGTLNEKARGIWDKVVTFFFGKEVTTTVKDPNTGDITIVTEKIESAFKTWVAKTADSIKDKLPTMDEVKTAVQNVWKKVIKLFFGEENTDFEVDEATGQENVVTTAVTSGFSKWFTNTVARLDDWKGTLQGRVKKVWEGLLGVIFGENQFNQARYDQLLKNDPTGYSAMYYKKAFLSEEDPIVQAVTPVIQSLGQKIGGVVSNLPTYIAQGVNMKIDMLKTLLGKVTSWLSGKNDQNALTDEISGNVQKLMAMSSEEAAKEIEGKGGQEETASPVLEALISVGQNLLSLVTTTIPPFLSEAWTAISDQGSNLWVAISTIFDQAGFDWGDIESKVVSIGETVGSYIEQIPSVIEGAVNGLSKLFHGESPLERARREIEAQFTDQNGNIIDPKAMDYALKMAEDTLSDKAEDTGLMTAVKEIAESIKKAFFKLGPDILGGLESGLDKLSGGFENITEWMRAIPSDKNLFDAIGEAVEGDSDASALWESIKSIGQKIKDFIIVTIPQFVSEGVAQVVKIIPKILNGLFGSGEADTSGAEAVVGIIDEETALVNESIKRSKRNIVNAVEEVKGSDDMDWLSSILSALGFENLFGGASADEVQKNPMFGAFDDYVAQFKKTYNKKVAQFQDFIENSRKSETKLVTRVSVLQDLRKRYEDLAWNNREDNIENAYDLTTEEGNEAYKARLQELADLIDLYSSISDEYVKMPTLSKPETKKKFEGATGLLGGLQDMVGMITSVGSSSFGQVAIIMFGIGYALDKVKDILTLSDEIEDLGYASKWSGIKTAILGIVGLLGWLTYLSSQSDANEENGRLKTTLNTLDILVGFVERIGKVMEVVAGLNLGGSFFGMFGSYFDAKAAKNVAKEAGKTGNFFSNLGTSVLSKLSELATIALGSDIIGGGFESLAESLGAVFSDIGLGIDNMMSFLDPALAKMANMASNIDTAITAVDQLVVLIGKLNDMVGVMDMAQDLNKEIGGVAAERPEGYYDTKATVVVSKIQSELGFLFALGSMMTSLSKGLDDFAKLENPTEKIKEMTEFIGSNDFFSFVEALSSTLTNAIQAGGQRGKASITDTAIGLEMLANAMSIFSDGLSGLNSESVSSLRETLGVFNELATMLSENPGVNQSVWQKVFSGDNSFSHFGQEIQSFGGSMQSFFNNIKHLAGTDDKQIANTEKRIDLVIAIAKGMAEAAAVFSSSYDGASAIEIIGDKMQSFGSSIGSFITAVNSNVAQDIDLSRIQMISTGITAVAEMMKGVGALMASHEESTKIPDFISQFVKGIAESFVGDTSLYTVGLTAATNLDSGLAEGFTNSKGLEAAQALIEAINALFDDNLNTAPVITPVVDMANVRSAAREMGLYGFGNTPFLFSTSGLSSNVNQANPANYQQPSVDYSSILSAIEGQLASMAGAETKVTTDLNNAQVVMDTGALVGALIGEIDIRLGRSGFYAEREG